MCEGAFHRGWWEQRPFAGRHELWGLLSRPLGTSFPGPREYLPSVRETLGFVCVSLLHSEWGQVKGSFQILVL